MKEHIATKEDMILQGHVSHSGSDVIVKGRFNTVNNCFTDFCTGNSLFN